MPLETYQNYHLLALVLIPNTIHTFIRASERYLSFGLLKSGHYSAAIDGHVLIISNVILPKQHGAMMNI